MPIAHEPRGHALRLGRFSAPNYVYTVTCVTHRRRRALADLQAGRCVVGALKFQQDHERAETLAYVVMPDHFHWLLRLCGESSLSRVMRSVKNFSAKTINGLQACRGRRLWQSGFHDHAVRSDEQLVAVARYIVANPLRARLVKRIGDYPLWDAVWLEGAAPGDETLL